ncbi:MAG TPA: ACP phosphodiesterase [Chitinophagaceae bacterium]|nr:ACP phosphodiesterase [Chitinophagaceae bacterium]
MNYLAHAYLSFGHPQILVGNLISDFVKGKKKFDYPPAIQQGITLHRAIDTFTDDHPVTGLAKNIFRPHYRLYSGAFIDVVYDHFLATDEKEFGGEALYEFSQTVFATLDQQQEWLPDNFLQLYPYMKSQNWLYNYRHKWGAQKSLAGVVRRATYLSDSETAIHLFEQHYQLLHEYYRQFWADLKSFALDQFEGLTGGSFPSFR